MDNTNTYYTHMLRIDDPQSVINTAHQIYEFDIKAIKGALKTGYWELSQCNSCPVTKDLKRCKVCIEVMFCSEKCQKATWKTHKKVCQVRTSFYIKADDKTYVIEEYPEGQTGNTLPFIRRKEKDCLPDRVIPCFLKNGVVRDEGVFYLHDIESKKKIIVFVSRFFLDMQVTMDKASYECEPVHQSRFIKHQKKHIKENESTVTHGPDTWILENNLQSKLNHAFLLEYLFKAVKEDPQTINLQLEANGKLSLEQVQLIAIRMQQTKKLMDQGGELLQKELEAK